MAESTTEKHQTSFTLAREPPRRGSFQEDIVLTTTNLEAHQAFTRNDHPLFENTAGHLIDVSNGNAIPVNGEQHAFPQDTEFDDDAMLTDDDVGFTKSSSGSRRHSHTPSLSLPLTIDPQQSPNSEDSTIEVGSNAYQLPSDPSVRTGKLRNKYVMPDGTVVNGRGLGRGRPGIKRGPRKSALSNEITETPEVDSITVSTPSPGPPARAVPVKRKRADSQPNDSKEEQGDLSPSSRDSTPEYNPIASTQTRSGRQSQKPAPIVTSLSSSKVPTKRSSLPSIVASPSIKKHPKIKAKVYRGREQFALCEHCLRGNGLPTNVIVFCDACNKCWHQRCHDPKIPKEVIADSKAEWFCSDCDRILHGKKKTKALPQPAARSVPVPAPAIPIAASSAPAPAPPLLTNTNISNASKPTAKRRYRLPYIPGMALTPLQRKQYLDTLSKEELIETVLRAANMAPNMPIFETPLPDVIMDPVLPQRSQFPFATLPKSMQPPTQPDFAMQLPTTQNQAQTQTQLQQSHRHPYPNQNPNANPQSATHINQPSLPASLPPPPPPKPTLPIYSHPTAGTPSKPNTVPPTTTQDNDDDEGYYDDFDELALLYPKPGEGVYDLALPPESSDLGVMLEGRDSRTFSHWVRGRGEMKAVVEGRV